jgi:ACS family hexuronate transporter-like MFS transporter
MNITKTIPYYWWVIGLSTLAMIGDGLVGQGIPVLYPFIRDDLQLTRAQVGLIYSAVMATSMITVVIGGWLSDSWGAKRILVITLFYTVFPILGFGLINTLWMAVIIGFLIGVGVGPFYPATSKQIIDWVPRKTLALGMSIKQTGPPIAGAIAAITLPSLALSFGWRTSTLFIAGCMLSLSIITYLLYRDNKNMTKAQAKISIKDLKAIVQNRDILVLTIWAFTFVGLQVIVLSYLILYLIEVLNYSEGVSGSYLSMTLLTSVIARVLWGAASDYVFKGRRKITLGIIGLIAAMGFFGISFLNEETSGILTGIVFIIIGSTAMSWPGIFTAYMTEISGPERSGIVIGITNPIVRLGVVIMPPLFGHFVDITNSYNTGWIIAGIIAISSTFFMLLLAREPQNL